ncbi:hypothetical protein EDC96DRAFT_537173 [Choanephora cucurbitarum]|nr:hypothetical protein EDC96DRAFT_537173 [Choanephora cucurbitarum]
MLPACSSMSSLIGDGAAIGLLMLLGAGSLAIDWAEGGTSLMDATGASLVKLVGTDAVAICNALSFIVMSDKSLERGERALTRVTKESRVHS